MVWRDLEKSERQSSGQSQSNGGKKGIPAEEVNIEVRRILRGNPSWDWTVKKLTEKVKKNRGGGSHGAVGSCPAWTAYHERRKRLRDDKTINTVSISKELEAVLGTGEKDEVLHQLIVEQGKEKQGKETQEDARQAKLFLSHHKKPQGREP